MASVRGHYRKRLSTFIRMTSPHSYSFCMLHDHLSNKTIFHQGLWEAPVRSLPCFLQCEQSYLFQLLLTDWVPNYFGDSLLNLPQFITIVFAWGPKTSQRIPKSWKYHQIVPKIWFYSICLVVLHQNITLQFFLLVYFTACMLLNSCANLIVLNLVVIDCFWSFDYILSDICKNTFLQVYTPVLCYLIYIIYGD